jgi:predicted kinase
LPGSGKSTYARRLEAEGVVRLSVDAELVARHGRIAVDYPVDAHAALLGPVPERAIDRLVAGLATGASVVFDHAVGDRRDRARFEAIAEAAGAQWKLVSMPRRIRRSSTQSASMKHEAR